MSERPVLLYDGDCGFCTGTARVIERLPVRADLSPWQDADLERLGVTRERAMGEVLLVDESHRVHGGAAAAAELLKRAQGPLRFAGIVLALPGVRDAAAWVYRTVAANRDRLPGTTPACRLPKEQRPGAGRHP